MIGSEWGLHAVCEGGMVCRGGVVVALRWLGCFSTWLHVS